MRITWDIIRILKICKRHWKALNKCNIIDVLHFRRKYFSPTKKRKNRQKLSFWDYFSGFWLNIVSLIKDTEYLMWYSKSTSKNTSNSYIFCLEKIILLTFNYEYIFQTFSKFGSCGSYSSVVGISMCFYSIYARWWLL